jgi:hypothetical protein
VAIGAAAPAALSGGTWTTGINAAYSFYSMPLTNTSASYYFYNPNGLTVMGYGLGSAESYYYLSGASARNLDAAFYVNDIHYQDLEAEVFCGQQSFAFRAAIQYAMSGTPGYLKWYINNVEETAARDVLQWNKTLAPGTYEIRMVVKDMYGTDHTLSADLIVQAQATAAAITTPDAGACNNSAFTLTGASTGVSNPVYRWYYSQVSATPLHEGTVFTTPQLSTSATYYVSVEGDNYCENAPGSRKAVTVTVNATLSPGLIGQAQAICYNTAPATLALTTNPSGGAGTYTYQWQSSSDNSAWSNINGATGISYSPGSLTANTYYRLTVTSGACATASTPSILITVNPAPSIQPVSDVVVCAGSQATVSFSPTPASGVTYKWETDNTRIGLATLSGTITTGNSLTFTAASDVIMETITANLRVTPVYGSCEGTPRTFKISVSPCVIPVNPQLRSRVIGN